MIVRKLAQAGACVLVMGLASVNVAEARIVAGAAFGISQFDYPDVDDGSARMFHLGYEIEGSPAYFEIATIDTGDADISGFNSVALGAEGMQIGVGYRMVLNQDTGSDFFLKGGFYDTDSYVKDPDGEICGFPCKLEDGNSGLYLGFGGTLMVAEQFGLRFDMQGLLGVEDFADDKTVTLIMFGPVFKFGGPQE